MKIAILGTRGIPGRYGGFETLADQLSRRLVERGHNVTVYCRKAFTRPDDVYDHRIRRVILPGVPSKHFDTLVHTFVSILHVLFTDAEVILMCNVANSPFAWIPRVMGKPTALNVDGLDRNRRKWNVLGQWFLHLCEMLSPLTPTRVVTDAKAIQDYYLRRYGKSSTMIAYGSDPPPGEADLNGFPLTRNQYLLYVSRLEPENNPELVIRAYKQVKTDWPLVIVGGNTYNPKYPDYLKSIADKRVIFTGGVYGEGYWALQKNAGLCIFASEVGGVHPALVEAMAAHNAVLYLDTPENRETAGNCGISFANEAELAEKISTLTADPGRLSTLADQAEQRAQELFSWNGITAQYETLLRELLQGR
jgi:glycosyltransferase involved in cell wall biosynthesis